MSEKFEVGDIAISVNADRMRDVYGVSGNEVTIVGPLRKRLMACGLCMCYVVSFGNQRMRAKRHWLRKKPPHREDHQLVKWRDVPLWQPSRERA